MKKLVALTGAGISQASGVPTFAEMGDIREKLSRAYFLKYPREFFDILINMKKKIGAALPNNAHLSLAEYQVPVVTMNIDGLHKKAGTKELVEIHGNLEFVICDKCTRRFPFDQILSSIYCPICGTILNPNVVLYGDNIPYFYHALDLIGSAERLLVVGTSFYTSTVNDLVAMAQRAGIKAEIINSQAEVEVAKYLEKVFK